MKYNFSTNFIVLYMYNLPNNLKFRPIVNSINAFNNGLAKHTHWLIQPLVLKMKHILTNSMQVIENLIISLTLLPPPQQVY